MAYPKRLNAKYKDNQDKAVQSHGAFISFVASEVKKRGLKKVLSLQKKDKEYWVKEAFDRLLSFAEQVQLKQIAQTISGPGEDGEFIVRVEIADENNLAQKSGNRIQQYFEV